MLNSAQKIEVAETLSGVEDSVLASQVSSAHTLSIEKVVAGGKGLARFGHHVVLVPAVLPGESVLAKIGQKRHGVLQAEVLNITQPSAERMVPLCQIFGQCGGCQFQHQTYESQLTQKRAMLMEAFSRIGKFQIADIPEVIPSPHPFGYRTVVRFVVFQNKSRFQLGFFREGTRTSIQASDCLLVPDAVRNLMKAVSGRLESQRRLPLFLQSIEIRWSEYSKHALLVFRGSHEGSSHVHTFLDLFDQIPHVVGWIFESPKSEASKVSRPPVLKGQDYLIQQFESLTLRMGFRSFVQANWTVYEAIGRTLTEWVGEITGQRVLELFAGVGALGLTLARKGALVTLVEANSFALADARQSAKLSHVGRCRFRKGTVESFLSSTNVDEYDVILVDPPRTGLSERVTKEIGRVRPPRLFYVSCDPATLARDLSRLSVYGYHITRVQPFDMFPQTAHIETLVELTV